MAKQHELMDIILGKSIREHNILGDPIATATFDYFIRQLPGALYYKDKNGKYLGCSNYLISSSGLNNPSDVIGKTDFELFSEEQAKILRKNDKKVFKEGKTLVTEEKITLPNGGEQYFEVVKTPLRDVSDKIVGIIGNSIEITNRVKAEQKLAIAKEKAELANVAKNQFIANMEHDLRTPCSGIAEMIKILEKEETDIEKKESLACVAKAANQLFEILNGILEFNHLESGKSPVLYKKFNLKQLLSEIIAMEMPAIRSKHLDLTVDCDSNIPEILIGDVFRTSRILINLVSNAVKFTSKGYIKIFVQMVKKINNKRVVLRIVVEDSGIGIPKDKQDIIYTRFTRVHPSSSSVYRGSGLGLSIVKQFVKELKGEIEVNSEVGRGTIFECLLPFELSLLSGVTRKRVSARKNSQAKMSIERHNLRVLLVEDDLLAQKVASIILQEQFAKRLDFALSGKNAIKLAAKYKYDIIFMDLGLPDMSGCDVTKRIRASKGMNKDTVIIALTAHDAGIAKKSSIKAGMNDFLVKPINEQKVLDTIMHWIDKKV